MRLLYRLLMLILLPFALLWLGWRAWRQTGTRDAWGERLGAGPWLPGGCIWLHAASVGEVQAAIPLVRELARRHPEQSLLVTSFTATGRARARAAFEGLAAVAALPWDFPLCVRLFLRRARPRALIVLETEIWPVLFDLLGGRGIPVAVVSARMSERTLRRYRRFRGLIRGALRQVDLVAAQDERDAERYRAAGAVQVRITGNIKFDLDLPAGLREQGEAVRMSLFPHRPVWIAASVRDGEERPLFEAFARVRERLPDLLLVIAPRYPERAPEIAARARRAGLAVVGRSEQCPAEPDTAVFLLDTLGELTLFYAAADVAFVGGSLVPVGGHNLLEPAALGLPVLSGPHVHNAPDIAERLARAGALRIVRDAESLARELSLLLQDGAEREDRGRAARRAVEESRGALRGTLEHLQALLGRGPEPD